MYKITLRDLYQSGTDTIIVSAAIMDTIKKAVYFDWTVFDTVIFDNAYPVSIVKI